MYVCMSIALTPLPYDIPSHTVSQACISANAAIASGAALVGPAPTAAIASSKGWRHLITPGIMCGIFGYAIATFIGVSITAFLG